MKLSTREAATKLGVTLVTLQRHIAARTIDPPALQKVGGVTVRLWSDRDIQKARRVLAGTKPGRKPKGKHIPIPRSAHDEAGYEKS